MLNDLLKDEEFDIFWSTDGLKTNKQQMNKQTQ